MCATRNYQYRPLSTEGEIRLAKIRPAASLGNRISITLQHLRLEDVGSFIALSYTWGDASDITSIYCDDDSGETILKVTKNCATALQRLRHTERLLVWVDIICINQRDTAERIAQVRQMRSIFSAASQVVAYLGEASDESDLGMDFIREISEDWKLLCDDSEHCLRANKTRIKAESGQETIYSEVIQLERARQLSNIPPVYFYEPDMKRETTENEMKALEAILSRPWFQRAWTLQEVKDHRYRLADQKANPAPFDYTTKPGSSLLRKDVTIMCGNKEVSLQMFGLVVCRATSRVSHPDIDLSRRVSLSPPAINLFRRQAVYTGLLDILRDTRACDTSVPADKVIAVLGLHDNPTHYNELVDYGSSTEQIFVLAAHMIARENVGSIYELLLDVDGYSNLPNLPSWIPDWTRKKDSVRIGMGLPYCAGGESDEAPILDGETLRLKGYTFDKIDKVFSPYFKGSFEVLEQWCDEALRSKTYPGGMPADFAFWHTVCGSRYLYDSSLVSFDHYGRYAAWKAHNLSNDEERSKRTLAMLRDHQVDPAVYDMIRTSHIYRAHSAYNFQEVVDDVSHGRRFVITSQGFFAIVPEAAVEGDFVAIFRGCRYPFVIRREEKGDLLVGHCYLHGVMDGEISGESMADLGHTVSRYSTNGDLELYRAIEGPLGRVEDFSLR